MSRKSRAKDLDEEIHRLFDQNVSEEDAYEQLKNDDRFDSVSLSKISTRYQQLRSQQGKKPKQKKPPIEIAQQSDQLVHFQSTPEECDHKKMYCLKFLDDWIFDRRFFITPYHESSNSTLKDVFSNKICRIEIPTIRATRYYQLFPLTRNIGLLTEYMDRENQDNAAKVCLSLLEFDWFEKTIQKVATCLFEDQQRRFKFQSVIVDAMDQRRFILKNYHGDGSITLKFGRVDNSELLFGDEVLTENRHVGLEFSSLIGNTLYSFDPLNLVILNQCRIYVTQFGQGEQTSIFDLSPLPGQFITVDRELSIAGCFAMNRLYLAVQNKETKRYGIAWTSHEKQTWETINFDIKKPIKSMKFIIEDHILLIQAVDYKSKITSNVHQIQSTIYHIPLKKPEKLAVLAWSNLVHSKRELKVANPYEEASQYLPYNSNIRCPFED